MACADANGTGAQATNPYREEDTMDLMRVRGPVIVCFSAGNLQTIAQTRADALVFADHDASGTGERIARATGRPWCMSPDIGDDANDMHRRHGIYNVAALMRPLMRSP